MKYLAVRYLNNSALTSALNLFREHGVEIIDIKTSLLHDEMTTYLSQIKKYNIRKFIIALVLLLSLFMGFWLQIFLNKQYPLNLGGKPVGFSPSMVPVAVEICILLTGMFFFFSWIAKHFIHYYRIKKCMNFIEDEEFACIVRVKKTESEKDLFIKDGEVLISYE
jgi:hypothetical protein